MILDGLFSNLSHDDMIDSAMESLALSAGHFQLIGMIHHPRYINNPKIFRSYFVGREFRAVNGKHSWLAVDSQKALADSVYPRQVASTRLLMAGQPVGNGILYGPRSPMHLKDGVPAN